MSVREAINNSKAVGVGAAAIIFAVAAIIMGYSFWPTQPTVHQNQGFYTDDDGKTYFRDSLYRFPPFDHNGKLANGAMVYNYSKGDFVAYQFRYKPDVKKRLEEVYAKAQSGGDLADVAHLLARPDVALEGCEIKVYGSDHWVGRAGNPHPHVAAPDGGDWVMANP